MTDFDRDLVGTLGRLKSDQCPSVEDLGAFLDQRLSADPSSVIAQHLQRCPACGNRLVDLRELARLAATGDVPHALIARAKSLVTPAASVPHPARTSQREGASLLSRFRLWMADNLGPPTFQWIAVSVVAVVVLYIGSTSLVGTIASRTGLDTAPLSDTDKRLVTSLRADRVRVDGLLRGVTSALQGLPKTLVLERTRGSTNVEVYRKAAPATVLIITDRGIGTGTLIGGQGDILTNWHVVENASELAVVFKPTTGVDVRKELASSATILKTDKILDLALLHATAAPDPIPSIAFGSEASIEVGADVHAIGHPDGEVWTYTTGTISQIRPRYQWQGQDGIQHQATVIQTQTAINPGNSGGPLLNDHAELIGINSFRGQGEGMNYAVALDAIRLFLAAPVGEAGLPSTERSAPQYKTERYGTNILGIYVATSHPPPDVWLIQRPGLAANGYLLSTTRAEAINTYSETLLGDPKVVHHYYDLDCNGSVDLVGFTSTEGPEPERYQLPTTDVQIPALAPEFISALTFAVIPYRELRVCGHARSP